MKKTMRRIVVFCTLLCFLGIIRTADPVKADSLPDIMPRAGAAVPVFTERDLSLLVEEARQKQNKKAEEESKGNPPAGEEAVPPEETGETRQSMEEAAPAEPESTGNAAEAQAPEQQNAPEAQPVTVTGGSRIICIDAGHQLHQNSGKEPNGPGSAEMKMKVTSGTRGVASGVPEYQLTLDVALKLQSVLQARGYSVVMCRTSNEVDISNAERAEIANRAGAGAFIRIHADGAQSSSAQGASTLAPSASNPYCAGIAPASQALAKAVVNGLCAKTGAKNRGVTITDTMTGLNWAKVPVTIVEMGFMTNPAEDMAMQDPSYQQKLAEGIADGIDAFFN